MVNKINKPKKLLLLKIFKQFEWLLILMLLTWYANKCKKGKIKIRKNKLLNFIKMPAIKVKKVKIE